MLAISLIPMTDTMVYLLQGHVSGAKELIGGGAMAAGADKEGFTPLHRSSIINNDIGL